jgi:stearoyl-CoA desaturase (delta-9 desaturase)
MDSREQKHPIDWFNVIFIGAVHLFALLGAVTFSWKALAVAAALWWITGSLGIGLGFHRLLTHQGFHARLWVRRFLTTCGTLAVQGGPIAWVAGHRLHHAHSDRELDPHNSRRGFWWSHVGWIVRRDPKTGDFENYRQYARDLVADRYILFLDRTYVLLQVALGLLLLWLGGWSFVVWGIFVRLVVSWHCTWLVNSAAHMFGYQTYESRDESRNCWWVALLSFGEGWHNNHHAFPRSARHGLRWWELDMNYLALRMLKAMGLVWDVRVADHLRPARGNQPAAAA